MGTLRAESDATNGENDIVPRKRESTAPTRDGSREE